ncbi:unnamed protein product [Peniophora sp. CBMAI 1063]|nr:unnamed protein product [Peniophora sp. CBMAI 1063]
MAEGTTRRASATRERSVTEDPEDNSDIGSGDEGQSQGGKPGRKKNPNSASQAARRDQNRIAQREFRLRKQQRIRDLEARVELLSAGEDQALGEMRNILKDLMAENHVLRGLIRSLSGFIGDGAGGLLPKLGWTMRDFEAYVNRSETDTAYESFQRRKNESGNSRKRSADDAGSADSANKRARGTDRQPDGFPALMPVNPMGPGGMFPPPPPTTNGRSPASNGGSGATLFSDLMRSATGGSSPMFSMTGASPPSGTSPFGSGPSPTSYDTSYMGNMCMGGDGSLSSMSFGQGSAAPAQPVEEEEERQDPKNEEAQKLMSYHLDNYKRNSQYCLPASLRPTLVQRTVPHESVIDRIPHPELRDRLILLRGRFSLVDCLHDYAMSVTIHGDDVLAHANWEINESWLRKYGFLVDQNTLNVTNKWRRERGASELQLRDIVPPEGQNAQAS